MLRMAIVLGGLLALAACEKPGPDLPAEPLINALTAFQSALQDGVDRESLEGHMVEIAKEIRHRSIGGAGNNVDDDTLRQLFTLIDRTTMFRGTYDAEFMGCQTKTMGGDAFYELASAESDCAQSIAAFLQSVGSDPTATIKSGPSVVARKAVLLAGLQALLRQSDIIIQKLRSA